MWIERSGDGYALSLKKGAERFVLSDRALGQLASLLEVGPALLARLRSMESSKEEDCRLLNKLLWHHGSDPGNSYRIRCVGDGIEEVFSSHFTSVHIPTLVRELEREEQVGSLRLVRFEISDHGFRLVLVHPRLAPVDLHRSRQDGSKAQWAPGAILTNQEDGSSSITAVPALVAPGGGRAIPVARRKADIYVRRHRGNDPAALSEAIVGDLRATAGAHFRQFGARFVSLGRLRVAEGDAGVTIAAMNLPFPSAGVRDQALAKARGRATSQYWLVMNILDSLEGLDPATRLRLESALGRLVWARGKSQA